MTPAPGLHMLRSELEATTTDADALLDHGRFDLSFLIPPEPCRVLEIGGDHGLGAVCAARLGHQVTFLRRPTDGTHVDRRFAEEHTNIEVCERFEDLAGPFDVVVARSLSRDKDFSGLPPAEVLQKITRHLGEPGLLILADRNRWSWVALAGAPDPVDGRRFGPLRGDGGWSARALRRAVTETGFRSVHEFGVVPHDRSTRQLAPLRWKTEATERNALSTAYRQFANEIPGSAMHAVALAHRVLPPGVGRSIVPATVIVASRQDTFLPTLVETLAPEGTPTVFSGRGLTDTVTLDRTAVGAGYLKYSRSPHRWGALLALLERVSDTPGMHAVDHRIDSTGMRDVLHVAPAEGRDPTTGDLAALAAALGSMHRHTHTSPGCFADTTQLLGVMSGDEVVRRASRRNPTLKFDVDALARVPVSVASCHYDWGLRNCKISTTRDDVVAFDWDLGSERGAAEVDAAQFLITEPAADLDVLHSWESSSGMSLSVLHLELGLASLGARWNSDQTSRMAERTRWWATQIS